MLYLILLFILILNVRFRLISGVLLKFVFRILYLILTLILFLFRLLFRDLLTILMIIIYFIITQLVLRFFCFLRYEAIIMYDRAILINPNDASSYYNKGKFLQLLFKEMPLKNKEN